MQALEFIWPYAALLMIVCPLIIWRSSKLNQSSSYLLTKLTLVLQKLAPKAKTNLRVKNSIPIVSLIIWSLLVLALMRPCLVGTPIRIEREGRNLMLAVDISESMAANDMQINGKPYDRLSVVKYVLSEFMDKRKSDRLGLVVFGSEAFLHSPLSFDHKTVKRFLFEAQIGFAGQKTAIGDAIALAVKKLIDQKKGDRILILLTDGQHNTGVIDPTKAAQIAKEHKVKIYTVGMGAEEMTIDGFFGAAVVNPSADLERGEPTLKAVSSLTGGKYFRGKDTNSLREIYDELDKLEPTLDDPLFITPKKELFYLPASIAALLLIFIWIFIYVRRLVF